MTAKDGPRNGRLIALEGLSEDALTTQLQLLPASPHVLVLPRVEEYFPDDEEDENGRRSGAGTLFFDVHRFIARVHAADAARRAVALAFLAAPSPTSHQKTAQKTVLLHGGTAASHALCIEAIRKHNPTSGGDLAQAARIFDDLIDGGLRGLLGNRLADEEEEMSICGLCGGTGSHDAHDEDPITRAMRAADALDRETEALQPSTHILDLTIKHQQHQQRQRSRSLDLPLHGSDVLLRDLLLQDRSPGADSSGASLLSTASPTSMVFPASMRLDVLAAQQQEMGPPSPGTATRRGRPRNRSSHPAASLGRNFLLATSREASVAASSASTRQTQQGQTQEDTCPDVPAWDQRGRKRAMATKRATTTVTTPKPKLSLETSSGRQPPRQQKQQKQQHRVVRCVAQGTNAPHVRYVDGVYGDLSAPILPLVEDLVICFVQGVKQNGTGGSMTGQTPDFAAALDVAVRRCRESGWSYRQTAQAQTQAQAERQQQDANTVSSTLPETPTSGHEDSNSTRVSGDDLGDDASDGDYDPFAPHQYVSVSQGAKHSAVSSSTPASSATKATRRQPPTPAHTPPLPPLEEAGNDSHGSEDSRSDTNNSHSKRPFFRTIAVSVHQTAVDLHNTLRACLHAYREQAKAEGEDEEEEEAETEEDSDTNSDVSRSWLAGGTRSDDDVGGASLWATPLLCAPACGIDLVLAVSSDDGVPPALTAHVHRRLDALGAVPHPVAGLPCNGRVDIRYLLANADLAWTAQRVRSRSVRNSGHKSRSHRRQRTSVLAALLLAQLDLYRRTNPAVRFVQLDCPPALLGLAAALQQLAGTDLVQVARLVAGGRSSSRSSSNRASKARAPVADIVLAAPATDADVTAFVEAVRTRLMAGSAAAATYYYRPQSPASSIGVGATASRASAALSTATTAAALPTPLLRPGSAADRASSPTTSRLVAKTIQVTAVAPRRVKSVAFSGPVEKEAAGRTKTTNLVPDEEEDIDTDEDDDGDDDADSLALDLDDLDDVEMRRLMPLFLRDRAALLAAKDAAGATCSWGSSKGAKAAAVVAAASAAPPSPSFSSSTSSVLASASSVPPLLSSASGPGIRPSRQQQQQQRSGLPERHNRAGTSTRKNNNNGQKARRWLGLA